MWFDYFDPASTDANLFINRDKERERLTTGIDRYLKLPEHNIGRAWAVIGDKGIGKSIFTQAVIDGLRPAHSGSTLFVHVDCRRQRDWKRILAAIASGLAKEIDSLKNSGVKTPPSLRVQAQWVSVLASFDDIELRRAHEQFRSFDVGASYKGSAKFLGALSLDFNIDVRRGKKEIESLEGRIHIDERRLHELLLLLIQEIRGAGLKIVLYLDNIDELDHDYSTDEALERVKRDVEGLLKLTDAPVALLLNMRTYFSRVLRREIHDIIRLRPLNPETLFKILQRRLEKEPQETRDHFKTKPVRAALDEVAKHCPTPLAFLVWVHFLASHDALKIDGLAVACEDFLSNRYISLHPPELLSALRAFGRADETIARDVLREACGGSREMLRTLEDLQIVLPQDFWSPQRLVLAPLMHLIHAKLIL